MNEIRIPRHEIEGCFPDHPRSLYRVLERAGVMMAPFEHRGCFQPISDWLEHDLPYLLHKPTKVFVDMATMDFIICQ